MLLSDQVIEIIRIRKKCNIVRKQPSQNMCKHLKLARCIQTIYKDLQTEKTNKGN